MSSLAIAAVGLAVFGFFAWHIASAVKDEFDVRRRMNEIEKTKEALDEAIKMGDVARIGQLRHRLSQLDEG